MTQTVPDISPLMPMHQDPLLVYCFMCTSHKENHKMHDDVIKWRDFPRNWPFVRGLHRSPVNAQYKRKWRGALIFSLICAWINSWVNNREAGDLRPPRVYYDVIVMEQQHPETCINEHSYRSYLFCLAFDKVNCTCGYTAQGHLG